MSDPRRHRVRVQLATTFTLEEVQVALFVFKMVQRGGNPAVAAKHRAWASLAKKFQKMERKAREKSEKIPPPVSTETDVDLQRYVKQGYTEKEARVIVEQLKKGEGAEKVSTGK